jgi:DNA mismatch repair protein MutS
VIGEARRYLEHLEAERDRHRGASRSGDTAAAGQSELPLFAGAATAARSAPGAATDALREALAAIDPDELSPKAALEALYALRRLLEAD